MSAWEDVPAEADESDPDDWAEYMADVYAGLRNDRRERVFHDRDGFYAEPAGSDQCLALGHTYDPDTSALTGDDEYLPRDLHPHGWGGGAICTSTRYGVACTHCEGECELPDLPTLWHLPGVMAKAA